MTQAPASYILWLPSWYPNKLAPFDGDFIQRHARAAALYDDIVVVFATPGAKEMKGKIDESVTNNGRLSEHIIYFKKRAGFLGRVLAFWKWNRLMKRAITQYIKENGRPRLVHVHVPMKAGLIARWMQKKHGASYVVSEHSVHYKMRSHDDFFDKNFIYRQQVATVFKRAAAVTNVSAAMGTIVRELFNLKPVRVINNTVDTSLFNYATSVNKKFRFIHVSTLTESQKNVTGILRAVEKLAGWRKDFEFTIVGPANEELREITRNSSVRNLVLLTGEISYAEVSQQMKSASALVLFSRYENLPCVIIEALCCGLPVIATDVGGVKELVNDDNGMLVQSEDEKCLAESMDRMINEYGKYDRERIAASAQARFSFSAIGKQFHDLYREIG